MKQVPPIYSFVCVRYVRTRSESDLAGKYMIQTR